MRRSNLKKILWLFFLFCVISGILMKTVDRNTNISAQSAPGGTISGRVSNDNGNGIKDIIVNVYDLNNENVAYTYTDNEGRYAITALAENSYKIHFEGSFKENYLGQWYYNAVSFDNADIILVTDGLTTPNADARLNSGGSISGHVTDYLGKNSPGIAIDIYDLNQSYIASTSTDKTGNYFLGGLIDGSYKIFFGGSSPQNLRGEWYNDKDSFAAADPVAITIGQITPNIDIELSQGAILNGQVIDDLGNDLQGIAVDIYDLNHFYLDYTYTGNKGNFSFSGLPGGNYKLYVNVNQQNFFSEWYNGKISFDSANEIAIMNGLTTNINIQLSPGGIISGRVTTNYGENIQDMIVDVYDLNHLYLTSTTTGKAGIYSIKGLRPGGYKVYFGGNVYQEYLGEWYNDQASFETAYPVIVTVGQTISAIDAQLSTGGIISGRVSDETGNGLPGVRVELYDLNYLNVAAIPTDSAGFYTLGGIHEGSYKVNFKVSQQNFFSEWSNDKDSFETADLVPVVDAQTLNINAQLKPFGIISGRIIDAVTGEGIEGIDIYAYDTDGNAANGSYTDEDGIYLLKNLPTGNFKIKFDPFYYNQSSAVKYKNLWYNDKDSIKTADIVAASAGQTTSGIDGILSMNAR